MSGRGHRNACRFRDAEAAGARAVAGAPARAGAGDRDRVLRGTTAIGGEINLFDEIMDKVLAEVEPLARRELAERLAELTEAPQRTLVRLAAT